MFLTVIMNMMKIKSLFRSKAVTDFSNGMIAAFTFLMIGG